MRNDFILIFAGSADVALATLGVQSVDRVGCVHVKALTIKITSSLMRNESWILLVVTCCKWKKVMIAYVLIY